MLPYFSFAQLNVSGKVTDKENDEPLPGANIVLEESDLSTSADYSGEYTLTNLKAGKHIIKVSFVGYKTIIKNINLQGDQFLILKWSTSQ